MATSPALAARLRDRRFYLFIAVLTAAIVFAGFARTFFLNGFFAKLHLPSLYILHGIVFSSAAWPLWPLSRSLFLRDQSVARSSALDHRCLDGSYCFSRPALRVGR